MIKIKRTLTLSALILLLALSFLHLSVLKNAVGEALALCAASLIPSLFPFLIYTELCFASKEGQRLFSLLARPFAFFFRTSREGAAAYLYGLIFGFPLGVKIIADGYKEGSISKEEAERLLLYSNNTGPAFLIGAVGVGLLGSAKAGLFLYLTEWLVSFLVGAACGRDKEASFLKSAAKYYSKSKISFPKIMQKCITQMLGICGYVIFFSVLASLISPLFLSTPVTGLFYALLEIGTASAYLCASTSGWLRYALLSFAVCFSGLSVYMQGKDLIADTDLSDKYYIPAKLLQGVLAFFAVFILSRFFG